MSSPPTLAETLREERAVMNEFAPGYREHPSAGGLVYRAERDVFTDWIVRTLAQAGADPARLRWLDLGSGTGEMLGLLHARGARDLTGLDLSEEMSRTAKRHVPTARFVQGLIESEPFAGRSFDAVVSAFTLHHLHDPRAFFAMVERCLRPGGWLFLLDYNAPGWVWDEEALGRALRFCTAPVRLPLRWKNRAHFEGLPVHAVRFNPSHRFRSAADVTAAAVTLAPRVEVHGVLSATLNFDLSAGSRVDRWVLRTVRRIDDALPARVTGGFQWMVGRVPSGTGEDSR